jgi:hypothetical protein
MQSEMLISAVVAFGVGLMATLSLLAARRRVAALQRARAGAQPRRRNANAHR